MLGQSPDVGLPAGPPRQHRIGLSVGPGSFHLTAWIEIPMAIKDMYIIYSSSAGTGFEPPPINWIEDPWDIDPQSGNRNLENHTWFGVILMIYINIEP